MLFFAHGDVWTIGIVLTIVGFPWVLALLSVVTGFRRAGRWIGVATGTLAVAIPLAFATAAGPLSWQETWTYVIVGPVPCGLLGMALNLFRKTRKALPAAANFPS